MPIYETALIIVAAFMIDCVIGDPQNPLHPVRIIGSGISFGIKVYKKINPNKQIVQLMMGVFLTLIIIALSYTVTKFITWGFYNINYWLGLVIEIVICYFLIAPKALKVESMKVYRSLKANDIEGARKNLSFIVGRETKNLNEPEVVKAAVETVAENLSDGVIAPLIFICIGNAVWGVGAPLAVAYKAVNTLDSMIGYRNEDFEYFGKFAARLDDVVNLIPARISALLMLLGSLFLFKKTDTKNAGRVYIRDRYNHKSPNSAHTEAVCAGALGLCLGGDSYYHGKLIRKPTIGDEVNEPKPEHIITANHLMYSASISAVVLLAAGSIIFSVLTRG